MSTLKPTTRLVGSAAVSPHSSRAVREPEAAAASRDVLFVIPGRGGGLRASIRGHLLEVAEPSPVQRLAPAPDDLFIASIASGLAWSARHFLHARGLPDGVSVSAEWRRVENPPGFADVSMNVTVSETAESLSDALEHTLAERVAARSLDDPTRLHLRCVG
ncbi:MAG TPA: OsmC family protein [Gaiellaceae bacterium]|nr:OsmC family protein [Gaiellaceae bacterium]